jgi:hypothetical protein
VIKGHKEEDLVVDEVGWGAAITMDLLERLIEEVWNESQAILHTVKNIKQKRPSMF